LNYCPTRGMPEISLGHSFRDGGVPSADALALTFTFPPIVPTLRASFYPLCFHRHHRTVTFSFYNVVQDDKLALTQRVVPPSSLRSAKSFYPHGSSHFRFRALLRHQLTSFAHLDGLYDLYSFQAPQAPPLRLKEFLVKVIPPIQIFARSVGIN